MQKYGNNARWAGCNQLPGAMPREKLSRQQSSSLFRGKHVLQYGTLGMLCRAQDQKSAGTTALAELKGWPWMNAVRDMVPLPPLCPNYLIARSGSQVP